MPGRAEELVAAFVLAPAAAWPGHAGPVTGDVRAQLEAVASA